MASEMNVTGWYAPAMTATVPPLTAVTSNITLRTASSPVTIGAAPLPVPRATGVYAYMKHFALNDQQINQSEMLWHLG